MGNGPSLQTPNGQSAVNPDTVAAGTAQTPAAAPAPAPQAVPTVELMLPPTPALGPSAFSPGLRKYRDMVQLQRDAALIRSETAKAFTELCADELKALAETTGSLAEFNQAAEKLKQTFLERLAQQRPELAEKLKNLQEEPDLLKHVSLRNNSLLDDAITPQLTTALVQKLYAAVHAAKTECDPHQRYGALHDLLLAPEDSTQFAAQKALALTHTSPTVIEETLITVRKDARQTLERAQTMARIEARAKLYSAIPEASKREEITSGLEDLETALSGRSPAQITGEEVRGALRLFGQRQELEQLFMRDPQFAENLSAYLALAAGGRGILEPQIRSVIANEIGSVQDAAAELQQALDGPARVSAVYRLCCRTGGMIPASEMEQAYLAHTGKPLGEVLAKLPASERGLIYSMLDGVMPNEQTLLAYYCAKLESYRRAQAAGNQPECQRIESELIAEIRGSAKLILRSPQFLLACEELAESAPALSFCARSVRMENELTQLLPENRQRAVCAILDAFNSQAHSARAAHGQKPDGDAAVVVLEQAAISACIKELEADGKSLQEVVEANPRLAQLLPAYFAHRLGTPSGERAAAQLSRVLQQQFISSHDVEYSTVGLQHQVRPTMGLVSPEEAQLYYENGGGDRRQALLLRYESAREALAQHRERTEQGAVQPAESQGPFRLASLPSGAGADSAQVDFAQRAAPLIQEMQLLIREYGPLMPLPGQEPAKDPWLRQFHETVSSDYARRTAAIYGALDKLDRESPIGVDFARIRRAEQQALLQAQTREYLSAHPDSTQEDWEQAGLTRLYPAAELEVMALAHAVEPHVQTIMLLETSWAARFAQAENEPEKLAALKREYEQGDQQKITQAYAELSRIKAARGELARELDVDALRNRVAEACRHARERAIVTGFLDGLVEKGIVSRTEIIAELAKGKCATADRDAQGSLHALDKPYDQIISADEALAYVARQRAIGLLEQMDCQTQSLANHLAHRTGLSGRFSPDAPSIPNIPQSALDSFNHQWQRFRADLQALSEEYPGMVDVGKLEQMQLLSLRRKQVIEWLETAAKKKDSDGEFTHSWAEIAEELRKNGGFDILPPARAKEFVISLRTAPLINELGELYFQMGALMTPARGNADAAIKYEAVKAEIRRREEALRVAFQGFEEFYKPDELQPKLAEKAYAGNRAYDEYAAKVRQEHEAEAQAREDAKGWGARAWDEIVKASKSAPKILEAAVDITAGNLWGLGNAVVAAVQLKNPIEAHANAGADFILGTRSLMNNYVWGGSALGSDEQLAAMGNWSLAMSVNPLGHLGATVVEPVFGIAELTYDETARAIYNLGQGVPKTYAEFKKLQEEDVLLKAGKYGYYTFELAGSLALLLATGGGSSATQGGRLSALLYRFGLSATNSIQGGRALQALSVAGGFSAVGAAGQELQDWDNASFSRWAEHTYSGTAHSMLFLGGMSAGTQLWVRMRFGAALPQTLEEFQQLRLADPARYLRLQHLMRQAMGIGETVDFLDAQSDLAQALANLDQVKDWRDLAGALMILGVSAADVADWKSLAGGAAHLQADPTGQGQTITFPLGDETATGRVSGNGKIVYVDTIEHVREMYRQALEEDLAAREEYRGRERTEIAEIARQQSEKVAAFYHPGLSQMIVPQLGPNPTRDERIAYASFILHENVHQQGGSELEAFQAQAGFLNRNGYELDLSSAPPTVRRADGTPRQITTAEIEAYLAKHYVDSGIPAAHTAELTDDQITGLIDEFLDPTQQVSLQDQALLYQALIRTGCLDLLNGEQQQDLQLGAELAQELDHLEQGGTYNAGSLTALYARLRAYDGGVHLAEVSPGVRTLLEAGSIVHALKEQCPRAVTAADSEGEMIDHLRHVINAGLEPSRLQERLVALGARGTAELHTLSLLARYALEPEAFSVYTRARLFREVSAFQPDSLASPAAILDASSPAYQALGHAQRAVDTAPSWPAAEGQELTEDETEARLTLLDERVEPLTLVERAELYSALVRHNMLELLSQNDLLRLEECAELQRLIEDSSAVPPPSLEARARLSMRLHALEGDLIGKTLKQDDLRYLTACEHVYMLGQTQQELALSGRAEELIAALCYLDEEAFKDVSALAQDIAVRGEEALAEILTAADALRYFASPERFDGLARARLMDRIAAMPKAPFGIDLTEVLPDESTPAFQALLEAQSLLRLAETTNQGPAPFSQADIEAILAEYTDPQAQQAARQILYHMSKYTDIGGTRQERLQLSSTEPVLYDVPTSGLLALRLDLVRMGKIRAGKVEAGQSAGATLYTPGTGTVGDCLAYLNNRRQLGGSGLQPHAHRHMDIPTTTDITQADYVLVDDAILHRLETDAEFARAVIENNIELVIPRGYAAGFRAGNLPGTAAQVRDRLGAAMARYQDAAAKHDTALANSRETLATRLEHLIESNASAQARFAKQLIQPLLDIAAEDAAANGISLKLALERLVNDRSRLIAAFNKLNDTDYDSSSKLPPAALGDFRNAVNLLSSAQGKAQDNAAALDDALAGSIRERILQRLGAVVPGFEAKWDSAQRLCLTPDVPSNPITADSVARQLNGHRHPPVEQVFERLEHLLLEAAERQSLALDTRTLTLLSQAIAQSARVYDTRETAQALRNLHQAIEKKATEIAKAQGLSRSDVDVYYVLAAGEKSPQMIGNMYRDVNGIPPERIVTPGEFLELRKKRAAEGGNPNTLVPVVLDDMAATGASLLRFGAHTLDGPDWNIRNLTEARAFFNLFKEEGEERPLIIATLATTTRARRKCERLLNGPLMGFVYLEQTVPINQTTAFKQIEPAELREKLIAMLGRSRYGNMLTAIHFPYGDTNTNAGFWQDAVEAFILPAPSAVNRSFGHRGTPGETHNSGH